MSDIAPPQQSATVSKAIHYSNISHSTSYPALQLKYLEKLAAHSKENNLPVPKPKDDFCSACNILLIPGYNVSIRIVYERTKKGRKDDKVEKPKRNRILRFKCLGCNHNNDHHNILHNHAPVKVVPVVEEKKDFKAEWTPPGEKAKLENKAKKRSQKRKKMNNLNLLLTNKKKSEAEKKNSLDLMDFMS